MKRNRCPYCGSREVVTAIMYPEKELSVCCAECPAEIKVSFAELGLGDGSIIDFDEMALAMQEVMKLWNRRAK